MSSAVQYLSQSIDYLGFLSAKLRDLRGLGTLACEFLQNADDAIGAKTVIIDIRDEALVISNDGVFTDCQHIEESSCAWELDSYEKRLCDFHRFRRVACRNKREEQGTTGAFGIGFISAYQVTDHPELISSGRHWFIRPEEEENRRIQQKLVDVRKETRFVLPWAFDEDTKVRRDLQVEPVQSDEIDSFSPDIEKIIPTAIMFLRKIERVEIRRNGRLAREVQRLPDGDELVVQTGSDVLLWRLFRGSFDDDAALIRGEGGRGIEAKRTADVTVAVPETLRGLDGILCAFLPSRHHTGLPFHINADFFPSSDRKRILLDTGDYQERWNKAALRAAAQVVSENLVLLRDLLGHEGLWRFISQVESVCREVEDERKEEIFAEFWRAIEPQLRTLELIRTSAGLWKAPAEAFLLGTPEEEETLPLLENLGLNIVHPDLRFAFGLLRRSEVGVNVLGLLHLADALIAAGLDRRVGLDSAPIWIRSLRSRKMLGEEIEILRQQRMVPVEKQKAIEQIADCAIALARNGELAPPQDLRRTPEETIEVFEPFGLLPRSLQEDNPKAISDLVEELTVDDAVSALEDLASESLGELWQENPECLVKLVKWFADHRPSLRMNPHLTDRLRKLPIWPSGTTLRPLTELVVPGNFEDPLHLARIVNLDALKEYRDFLVELGTKELTLPSYVLTQIPLAFCQEVEVSPEIRRRLVQLLARHRAQLVDTEGCRATLASCPLVECADGIFRMPEETYFSSADVVEILGEDAPVALPSKHFCINRLTF